jgi:uncharacterized Zn-finger protein
MTGITLPSINNLPLQNLSLINLPPIQQAQSTTKSFYCKECPKKFNRKNSLIRHLRVHAGVKPYTCDICCKSFSRKDILGKHKESVKCIKKAEALNAQQKQLVSETESEISSIPSPHLNQSIMSISSLISNTTDLISNAEEYLQFNDYKFYDVTCSRLVLPSQTLKSNSYPSSDLWN